jgi:hypothetical protein
MGAPRSRPPLDPNMLCEYPNNVSFHARGLIEQVGGYSFDGVAIGQKLRLPRDALRTSYPCEIVHRGVADLTLDRFAIVQHRKCERQPLVVVSHNLATRQRHRNPHPRNSASGSRHMRTISPDGCARAAISRIATLPAYDTWKFPPPHAALLLTRRHPNGSIELHGRGQNGSARTRRRRSAPNCRCPPAALPTRAGRGFRATTSTAPCPVDNLLPHIGTA